MYGGLPWLYNIIGLFVLSMVVDHDATILWEYLCYLLKIAMYGGWPSHYNSMGLFVSSTEDGNVWCWLLLSNVLIRILHS